jgi:hypothetical protein
MTMEPQLKECYDRALNYYDQGYISHEIYEMLKKEGVAEHLLAEAMCNLKLTIYKKRKSKGVAIGAIGGIMLLLGFVVSVIMFRSGYEYEIFMYGFTSIGTILLCWGGYEVLH